MRSAQVAWLAGVVFFVAFGLLLDSAARSQMQPPKEPKAGKDKPDEPPPEAEETEEAEHAPELKKLTDAQVSRIRYLELRAMRLDTRKPDSVEVKIPQDTIDQFLKDMEKDRNYEGEKSKREFRKATPPQKLHYIAELMGAEYAGKVEIKSDPELFVTFRKNVMPIVLQTCAVAGCHNPGNKANVKFRLFKDPKKLPATTYANFIILNDLKVGSEKVLNRDHPKDSLLLMYMLNPKEVPEGLRHPGPSEYKWAFQSRKDPNYKRIEDWILSLKHPAEDYGIHLIKPPSTAPADADKPDADQPQ